jgi:hypothetical protein
VFLFVVLEDEDFSILLHALDSKFN